MTVDEKLKVLRDLLARQESLASEPQLELSLRREYRRRAEALGWAVGRLTQGEMPPEPTEGS
jgi:hypothetical protein